jgi:4-diphosphocytidyl-2-C-methyl-D-erythritol kinase
MTTVRRLAPAKLNLYLHLVGRRADGYHLLDSLFAFADVGDEIEVVPAPDLSLFVEGPYASAIDVGAEDNLVLRAARALREAAGVSAGARIRLVKNLPVAAGIGGGSADAAATLQALGALWGARLAPDALADLALRLGADVPACLAGRPIAVSGIGEILSPAVSLPPVHAVLANPNVACPTPPVFRAYREAGTPFSDAAPLARPPCDASDLAAELGRRRNDLEAPARALVPEIAMVLAALGALPGALIARMSGSGATCFALFAKADEAEAGARALAAAQPRWWVRAAPLL